MPFRPLRSRPPSPRVRHDRDLCARLGPGGWAVSRVERLHPAGQLLLLRRARPPADVRRHVRGAQHVELPGRHRLRRRRHGDDLQQPHVAWPVLLRARRSDTAARVREGMRVGERLRPGPFLQPDSPMHRRDVRAGVRVRQRKLRVHEQPMRGEAVCEGRRLRQLLRDGLVLGRPRRLRAGGAVVVVGGRQASTLPSRASPRVQTPKPWTPAPTSPTKPRPSRRAR
jgi:hypothetical protein